MWGMWKDSKPGKAHSALKGALTAISLYPGLGIILWFFHKKNNPDIARNCLIANIVVWALLLIPSIL